MRKRKRQAVKKLIQCAAVIAAGVLAIILFMLAIWYRGKNSEAAGVEWLEQKTDFNILGIIRYSKKVAENTFMRKPIYEYSPCCGAAQGYKKFVTAYTGKAR